MQKHYIFSLLIATLMFILIYFTTLVKTDEEYYVSVSVFSAAAAAWLFSIFLKVDEFT